MNVDIKHNELSINTLIRNSVEMHLNAHKHRTYTGMMREVEYTPDPHTHREGRGGVSRALFCATSQPLSPHRWLGPPDLPRG